MPQHVPGQPADATTTGFDWNNPLNAAEKARLAETIDILTAARRVARVEVESFNDGEDLLETAQARRLDLLVNLPPFPLPGTLAPVTLADTTVFFAFWQAMYQWLGSNQTVPVTTAEGTANVTSKPLDVFRKFMSSPGA